VSTSNSRKASFDTRSLHGLAVFLAAAFAIPALAQPAPPAEELAAALQTKYDGIRDFSADFIQVYEGGVLRKKPTAERPGSKSTAGRVRLAPADGGP
jgi:hypothetical protein